MVICWGQDAIEVAASIWPPKLQDDTNRLKQTAWFPDHGVLMPPRFERGAEHALRVTTELTCPTSCLLHMHVR